MMVTKLMGPSKEPSTEHLLDSGYTTAQSGDFVTRDGDNAVAEATAESTALFGRVTPDLDGVHAQVIRGETGVWFLVHSTITPTATMVGTACDLAIVNGEHKANVEASSTGVFKVEEIVDADAKLIFVSIPAAKSQAYVAT